MMKKGASNLGRGLAALLGDDLNKLEDVETASDKERDGGLVVGQGSKDSLKAHKHRGLLSIAISDMAPNPRQPRKNFNDASLDELSTSIKKNGILQPLIVTPIESWAESRDEKGDKDQGHGASSSYDSAVESINVSYIIVAGERRWRAAQRAGLHEVPAIVKQVDEQRLSEIAIVENIQREDLTPLELAEAYSSLIERFSYRQEDLAQTLGKSRSTIANSMRLLSLPASIKDKLAHGELSEGHARLLIGLDEAVAMAEIFVKKSLSVREAEKIVSKLKKSGKLSDKQVKVEKNPNLLALEQEIEEILGLKTQVEHGKSGGDAGKITIFYQNAKQLDPFLHKIRG